MNKKKIGLIGVIIFISIILMAFLKIYKYIPKEINMEKEIVVQEKTYNYIEKSIKREEERLKIEEKIKNNILDDNVEITDENDEKSIFYSNDDHIINILLIGNDKRPNENHARSDSMIIVSMNKTDNTIKLISLMRDMYVAIPGRDYNRLNAAYSFGGSELLIETIKENFDVNIDGVVEIDFSNFKDIVDIIGGIDIELNEKEIEVINEYTKGENKANGIDESVGLFEKPGIYHLNGGQVLTYSRIRKVGNGDFERTERQRTVLIQIAKRFNDLNIIEIIPIYKKLLEHVDTNINDMQILEIGTFVLGINLDEIETYNIPKEAIYTNETINNMAVLVPDVEVCKNVIHDIMNNEGKYLMEK